MADDEKKHNSSKFIADVTRDLVEDAAREARRTVDRKYADSPTILGSYVRDNVTGFEGIAVGYTQQITGCNRITIQPTITFATSGRGIPDSYAVDESHVEILEQSNAIQPSIPASEQRGGPPSRGIPM